FYSAPIPLDLLSFPTRRSSDLGFAHSLPLPGSCFFSLGSAAPAPDRGPRTRPYVLAAPATVREVSRSHRPLRRRSAWRAQDFITISNASLRLCGPCRCIAPAARRAYTVAVTPTSAT